MNNRLGFSILLWVLSLFFSVSCYALPFNIAPNSALPTSVIQGQTATAYYTVTNKTQLTLVNNFVKYLPLNVSQVITDNNTPNLCGSTFTLAAGASCALELTINGAVNAADPNPKHHLFVCTGHIPACAGTLYPLNVVSVPNTGPSLTAITITPATAILAISGVQQYTATGTYSDNSTANITNSVTWSVSNTSVASITASGGLVTGLSAGQITVQASLNGVSSNSASLQISQPMAYIANRTGNNISICAVNTNGSFQACSTTSPTGVSQPDDIVINNAGNRAYILNSGNSTLIICNVNIGGALSSCAVVNDPSFSLSYGGITLNSDNSLLYVTNYNTNSVSICPLKSDGTLSTSCTAASKAAIQGPNGRAVLVSKTTNVPVAYIPNYNGSSAVATCIPSGTNFSSCAAATINSGTLPSSALGLNVDVNQKFIYVAANSNVVTICAINNNASLSSCANSGQTFHFDGNVINLFLSNTNVAYIPNPSSSPSASIAICPINTTTGALTSCTNQTDVSFNDPESVFIAFQSPV